MSRYSDKVICLLVVLLVLTIVGCGGGGEAAGPSSEQDLKPVTVETPEVTNAAKFEGAEPGSGKGLKIGYISLGESVPFAKLVSDGIREQAKKAGAELVFCDSQLDAAKARQCAVNLKTKQVDGILNFQLAEDAAPEICAAGPDVPVIAIDIHQRPCEDAFMGANNKLAGKLAGRAMGKFFKQNFDCEYDAYVSLEQPAAGVVNEDRLGGYRTGFSEVCGEIKELRKVDGTGTIDGAREVFTDVLTSLPGAERIVVVAINDDSILGALAAAKGQNRQDDIYVSGQGADPTAWCEIKNNPHWVADTAYFPERYGEILVPNIIRAIKGKQIPDTLYVPHAVVTGVNIDEFYEVKNC